MPNHFFYFVLSKSADTSGLKYPNMEFIREEEVTEYNTIHTNWPSSIDKYFHRMYGKWPVDLIFTSRTPMGALLKQKMTNVRSKAFIPVFMFVTKALGKNETHDQLFDTDLRLRGLSYSECPSMFLTQHEVNIAMQSMRGSFTPTAQAAVKSKLIIACQGMDVKRIEKAIKGVKKNEKLTLFFGARLLGNKRWDDIVKLYWDINVASGGRYDIELVSPGGDSRLSGSSIGTSAAKTVRLDTDLSQEESWRRMAAAHICMSWSQYEGLPIGFVEQIVCGLVFICYRRPWSEATFGEDYPFFFSNKDEARALVTWACKRLHEAQEKMKPWREKMIEKYNITTTVRQLQNWWAEGIRGSYFETLPTRDLTVAFNNCNDEFTLQDFIDELLDHKPGYTQALCQEYVSTGSAELTRRDCMNWIRKEAIDLHTGALPKFRKKG